MSPDLSRNGDVLNGSIPTKYEPAGWNSVGKLRNELFKYTQQRNPQWFQRFLDFLPDLGEYKSKLTSRLFKETTNVFAARFFKVVFFVSLSERRIFNTFRCFCFHVSNEQRVHGWFRVFVGIEILPSYVVIIS